MPREKSAFVKRQTLFIRQNCQHGFFQSIFPVIVKILIALLGAVSPTLYLLIVILLRRTPARALLFFIRIFVVCPSTVELIVF